MLIDYDNEQIENLIKHKYIDKYKKFKSNTKLIRDLDKVIKYLQNANDILTISRINSLHYEKLVESSRSSVRVGYDTKYRLEFYENEDKLTLILIELSEHYGDH